MTVICNATPLINFAAKVTTRTAKGIARLDILQATFAQIIIPQAVYDETTGSGFPGTQFVLQAIAAGWLQVHPVTTIAYTIPANLDDGEREAIALALEIGITTSWGSYLIAFSFSADRAILVEAQNLIHC